jgi:hypothetical protein
MAIINNITCITCGKPFSAILGQSKCNDCIRDEMKEEKVNWLVKMRYDVKNDRPKTLEERVEQIEEWIYANKDNNDIPI